MRMFFSLRFLLSILIAIAMARAADSPPSAAPQHPLVWDAMEKTVEPKPGDSIAEFSFSVRNRSSAPVEIRELQPSCGCTVPEMPQTPWVLEPGASGTFRATVDFTGKVGKFGKTIHVVSSAGAQLLALNVNIPDTEESRRARNQQLAAMDRQAVFRNDCASCHVTPAVGKMGAELFQAACAICHAAEHRASMVPDLAVAREPRDAAYWRRWIGEGKARTLMPAFAQEHGGPLTTAQVESLIAYAMEHLPTQPAAN